MELRAVLGVLGLQFCLICLSYEANTKSQTALQRAEVNPVAENGHGELHQPENEVFGLGLRVEVPHDSDIIQMTHNVRQRRSEKRKKKKKPKAGALSLLTGVRKRHERSEKRKNKRKSKAGAYSSLSASLDGKKMPASSRTKREERVKPKRQSALKPRPHPHQGQTSPIGSSGNPSNQEVVRTKRQSDGKKKKKTRPGSQSLLGRTNQAKNIY